MPVVPRTSELLRATDRILSGQLAAYITRHRRARVSWAALARLLKDEHDVEVTGDTLRRWADELGIEDEREAS